MLSVIVPSYGRASRLAMCLRDLQAQVGISAFEVIVVVRSTDHETRTVVDQFADRGQATFIPQLVDSPGIVAALRAGWSRASGECIAFCDDDARYPPTWLKQLEALLHHEAVGAAGGPIDQPGHRQRLLKGQHFANITWYGRTEYFGFDRQEALQPFDVDWLPGANLAVRRRALAGDDFDVLLDAPGSSPGWELSICWHLRQRGWRVIVDPTLHVVHEPAPWVDASRGPTLTRTYAYSRNTMLVMLRNLPFPRRIAFLVYFWLIGQHESPGLLFAPLVAMRERHSGLNRMRAALRGKKDGFVLAMRYRERGSPQPRAPR